MCLIIIYVTKAAEPITKHTSGPIIRLFLKPTSYICSATIKSISGEISCLAVYDKVGKLGTTFVPLRQFKIITNFHKPSKPTMYLYYILHTSLAFYNRIYLTSFHHEE